MGRPRKKITLSEEDKRFVLKYHISKTAQEISRYLEKPPSVIQEYISFISPENPAHADEEFRALPEYRYLKMQYTPDEMELFEQLYTEYKNQFKDILATERRQVLQVIELDIFMHRIKIKQRRDVEDASRISREIDIESYGKTEDTLNTTRVDTLTSQLNTIRAAEGTYAKTYNDYLSKHSTVLGNLKGTRDQRIKVADNSRFSFPYLVKLILENDKREEEAKRMEIMRHANDQEMDRLSKYHKYLDSQVDRPIFNSDTVKMDENEG